ncbi:HNH endonuclease [Allosphingosinicella flava]|uniref:HNH endonuclease n=1 Tax=Allosphingosinicella flava TaxID=2771430 RepID=A0A7T2GKJ8_9SPHN|nr:HNH endonuclease [Sphingosinicella flava]QPQ55565.1 HNH endonuclease [Sphingosinicella flava]
MKGRAIPYSAEEMAWLEENRLMVISDYTVAFNARFGRNIDAKNLHALRKRKGWKTGRTGCFAKGQEPHNKGKPCAPGKGGRHPNARKTQFRKGNRTGRANLNYQPIGTERITEDGYRERKIHDGLPMQSRWQLVQRIEWEKANGPIPEGYALKCLNGDKFNTDPSNWEPIHRGVLARLNGGRFRKTIPYDAAAPELKPTIMALAKLKHAARRARDSDGSPKGRDAKQGSARSATARAARHRPETPISTPLNQEGKA